MKTNRKQANNPSSDSPKPARRTVLGWLVAAINLVVGAVVVGPVLGFIGSPVMRRSKSNWVPILDDAELGPGQTRETSYILRIRDGFAVVDRKYTVFLKRSGEDVVAFDPTCTHLGCRVTWVEGKERYLCPCHGGVFDADGNVVSGPPPKPLITYPVKVEDGKIWIQKKV